ncbi:MAG: DNA-3-methyladenine glycosylase 2 family protein [Acidobacteria bacterium]|nr:DNA-3-methyladenine glycosylase 2 family protein [Acidobacteriota bacterium]
MNVSSQPASIDYSKARRSITRRDPILGDVIRSHGRCGLIDAQHTDPFQALVHAIVSQQLSTKAAATIAGRVDTLLGGLPTPARVRAVSDGQLRTAGLSGQKVAYLRDLCRRLDDGSLRLDVLNDMSDEAVIEALTSVKGIGRWTAEMFLIFRLHRPDVLPVGDLGIVKAIKTVYGLRTLPTPERMLRLGEAWRPYRSVASWYLWASLKNTTKK